MFFCSSNKNFDVYYTALVGDFCGKRSEKACNKLRLADCTKEDKCKCMNNFIPVPEKDKCVCPPGKTLNDLEYPTMCVPGKRYLDQTDRGFCLPNFDLLNYLGYKQISQETQHSYYQTVQSCNYFVHFYQTFVRTTKFQTWACCILTSNVSGVLLLVFPQVFGQFYPRHTNVS